MRALQSDLAPSLHSKTRNKVMFDFGDCRDDSSPLDLSNGFSPTNTSLFDFYRALHDFLCRNRIKFIWSFRMRLEGTTSDCWKLLIEGKTSGSDFIASDQVSLHLPSPVMPLSSNNPSANKTAWGRTGVAFGSLSVPLTI